MASETLSDDASGVSLSPSKVILVSLREKLSFHYSVLVVTGTDSSLICISKN